MRRRLLTFVIVAAVTAASTSAWLYDGNLIAAVDPIIPAQAALDWNAQALASREGIAPGTPASAPASAVPAEGEKTDPKTGE